MAIYSYIWGHAAPKLDSWGVGGVVTSSGMGGEGGGGGGGGARRRGGGGGGGGGGQGFQPLEDFENSLIWTLWKL